MCVLYVFGVRMYMLYCMYRCLLYMSIVGLLYVDVCYICR